MLGAEYTQHPRHSTDDTATHTFVLRGRQFGLRNQSGSAVSLRSKSITSYVIEEILIWLVFSLHSYCSCPLISLVIPQ